MALFLMLSNERVSSLPTMNSTYVLNVKEFDIFSQCKAIENVCT